MADRSLLENAVRVKFDALRPLMNERVRRCWAATEAQAIGYGGVSAVARATGFSRHTIIDGLHEIAEEEGVGGQPARVRRPGGGRKSITSMDRSITADLEALVQPSTRGDPMSPLRWTCKSTRKLAEELRQQGHRVGERTVSRLLHGLDYSLQGNRKTREGSSHPDRDAQFNHINEQVAAFQKRGQPVVSVDTKKKENVGNYANKGREWEPKKRPKEVNMHDFPNKELGKGIPYGVYDLTMNEGWVSVGIDHDTAYFATATLRRWWEAMGIVAYRKAKKLLVAADGGGSNSSRSRLWKVAVQELAQAIGLKISICHFPPGTSKWNKIEHRMFNHITQNWRGQPLTSHEVIVNLIGNTTTDSGLHINAELDVNSYKTGIKVTDEELAALNIVEADFHGNWNYTISPRKKP